MRYDIAIVGSGPAGLSAAINGKIRNKNIIVFGTKELSGKVNKAPKINNYLGLPGLDGKALKEHFTEHIEKMGITITEERINNIYAMGDYFALMVNEKMYEASTVILATGVEFTRPIKGEEQFLGRGVGYCATCDAPLYKNKIVAVVGYNHEAAEEANYVSELASKVYFVPMYNGEKDLNDNIEIIKEKPIEVAGENLVNRLIFRDKEVKVDGVFFLKDSIAPNQLMPGLEVEGGHIKVDRTMATNIKGCFAAGDIVGKPYQYIKGAGEGLVAALSAVSYLEKLKKSN